MKLTTKMLLGTAVLAIAPILLTSTLVGGGAVRLSRASLTDSVQDQLVALREVRKQQVSSYLNSLANALRAMSVNSATVDGFKALRQGFDNTADLPKPDVLQQMKEELKGAYLKDFATEFSKRNPEPAAGLEALVDNLTPTQIALQHAFITANPNPLGSKNKMAEATARSTYSAAHTRVHPSLEAFRDKLGFYDIFLIDPQSSRIVYTAFKELDFTSSLVDGPAAKTGLGDVYRKVKAAAAADAVALSDYAPYFISYNDQASFIAMPLMDGGKMIGVIAAQMPLDSITELMTASRKWKSQGLRESGETYLVGSDLLMRTDSRFLLEDKPGFLKALGTSVSAAQLALADKKNTSIGVVKVGSEAAREAIAGKDGVGLVNDYRGLPVFSAYGPLDVLGLRLGVIAEMDEAEALSAATELRNQTIVNTTAIALLVLLVAGVAGYVFVRSITRPVIDLSNLVNEVAKGNDQARSQVKTGDELQDLGDTFNTLLDDRIAKLSQAQTENENLNNSVVSLLQTVFELSNRNLNARAEVTQDVVGTVADSVNMLANATADAMSSVNKVALAVSDSSKRVNQSSQALAAQADEDRVQVNAMADDIAQTSRLMQQVAQLANDSRQAANEATATTSSALRSVTTTVGEMTGIRESIGEMEKRVKRLGERSQEISQIVSVINSISERTHVLALNASMQAAMAGEAGRGFAVVTEEVQRLADASRNATMQIGQLAQNIQLETSETVAALNRTVSDVVRGSEVAETSGAQMRETEMATARLADAVQRIANESASQIALAARLSERVTAITKSTEQTQKLVKGTTLDAEQLANSSTQLTGVVSEFKFGEQAS